MGTKCTTLDKDDIQEGYSREIPPQRRHNTTTTEDSASPKPKPTPAAQFRLTKHGPHHRRRDAMAPPAGNWSTLNALNAAVRERKPKVNDLASKALPTDPPKSFEAKADYDAWRKEMCNREAALAYDHACEAAASQAEKEAQEVLKRLRSWDEEHVYAAAQHAAGHGGQMHPRIAGDRFLSNVELMESSAVWKVARRMPKGAHLHIHFNACLKPKVLLDLAKKQQRMFIRSDIPLVNREALDLCEVQFSILAEGKEGTLGNVFDEGYTQWVFMPYGEFRKNFPTEEKCGKKNVDAWLEEKLVFGPEETYGVNQTAKGAWVKFNGRTRMMKGLFNYETAYKVYTRACLQDFVDDNIQYAEIRPNFMHTNQVWSDDGTRQYDNKWIMNIIKEAVDEFKKKGETKQEKQGSTRPSYFQGIKVIYCTPRSFDADKVKQALTECIKFKELFPDLIAGFDLVGEEAAGKPLNDFIPQFIDFKKECADKKLDIPFLFHCGETLEMGEGTADGNLVDALLLGAPRIGHGFALARHPYVMEQMKARGVCLELCPISNEILGLTPRVGGHAMYNLLANNVHCTLSSDNGTLFRSSLTHDFYQFFVGRSDVSIWGWRQLVEWSIEHSCLSTEEREKLVKEWTGLWEGFVGWINAEGPRMIGEEEKVKG